MRFEDRRYGNELINLNGNDFRRCTFEGSEMIFNGVGPVGLVDCNFINCRWKFEGPASDTVAFMKELYATGGGGKELIVATFNNIAPSMKVKH
jgi:hypothetical protein